MKHFISWVIIKRLTEFESILQKRGIEAHFRARLQPYWLQLNSFHKSVTYFEGCGSLGAAPIAPSTWVMGTAGAGLAAATGRAACCLAAF